MTAHSSLHLVLLQNHLLSHSLLLSTPTTIGHFLFCRYSTELIKISTAPTSPAFGFLSASRLPTTCSVLAEQLPPSLLDSRILSVSSRPQRPSFYHLSMIHLFTFLQVLLHNDFLVAVAQPPLALRPRHRKDLKGPRPNYIPAFIPTF